MAVYQSMLASSDYEIDLREVFAAFQRRWRWVVGGGLLGMALAAGVVSSKQNEPLLSQTNLIVDVARTPCRLAQRNLKTYRTPFPLQLTCAGEAETMRWKLDRLAKEFNFTSSSSGNFPDGKIAYSVDQLAFDAKGESKSATQLVLNLVMESDQASGASAALGQIKKRLNDSAAKEIKENNYGLELDPQWIIVEEPVELIGERFSFSRSLALGLFGGLVAGACSALIADRRSNRVYSQAELLRRLGHPLRLGLPAGLLTTPAVQVLVGQLATQLDQTLSWRVLSIARQHEAVAPLTQLLQQQGGTRLQCNIADPLLSAVLRFEPSDKPTGLLLVVEPGFNSARALEEARWVISQMGSVQAVGVVLIGAPLPEELNSSAAA